MVQVGGSAILDLMNTNPLHEGPMMIHGRGIGTVNPDMIENRAAELAVINGREPGEASLSDLEQAGRELSGGLEQDSSQTLLESASESDRWNPIPGSQGREALVDFDDNEDEDGRGIGARLVEDGVEEAAHDQMLAAGERVGLVED
jgi:hypothetical protein